MAKLVYRAKQGIAFRINGQRYHFGAGDLILEDHPVKPGNNPNFEEISAYLERISVPRRRGVPIEDATAEPGVQRRIGRPRGTKNKPAAVEAEPVKDVAEAQKEEVPDGQE